MQPIQNSIKCLSRVFPVRCFSTPILELPCTDPAMELIGMKKNERDFILQTWRTMDAESLRNKLKSAAEKNDLSTWNPSTFTKYINWLSSEKIIGKRLDHVIASYNFLRTNNASLNIGFYSTLLDLMQVNLRKKGEYENWNRLRLFLCDFHMECFPELTTDVKAYMIDYSKDDLNFYSNMSDRIIDIYTQVKKHDLVTNTISVKCLTLLTLANPVKAASFLDSLGSEFIPNVAAYKNLIASFSYKNDFENSQLWFEKYLKQVEDKNVSVDKSCFLEFAKALVRNDRLPAAVELLTEVMPQHKLFFKPEIIFRNLIRPLIYHKKYDDALQLYSKMDTTDLSDSDLTFLKVQVFSAYVFKCDLENAKRLFEQLPIDTRAEECDTEILYAYSILLLKNNQFEETFRILDMAFSISSSRYHYFPLYQQVSILAKEKGEVDRAMLYFFKLLEDWKSNETSFRFKMRLTLAFMASLSNDLERMLKFLNILLSSGLTMNSAAKTHLMEAFHHWKNIPNPTFVPSVKDFKLIFDAQIYVHVFAKEAKTATWLSLCELVTIMENHSLKPTREIHEKVVEYLKKGSDIMHLVRWENKMQELGLITQSTRVTRPFTPFKHSLVDDQVGLTLFKKLMEENRDLDAINQFYFENVDQGKYPNLSDSILLLRANFSLKTPESRIVAKKILENEVGRRDMILGGKLKLYAGAIRGLYETRQYEAAKEIQSQVSRFKKNLPNDDVLKILLDISRFESVNAEDIAGAEELLAVSTSIPLDEKLLLPMLDLYSKSKDVTKASETLKVCAVQNLCLSTFSCTQLRSLYMENKDITLAMLLLRTCISNSKLHRKQINAIIKDILELIHSSDYKDARAKKLDELASLLFTKEYTIPAYLYEKIMMAYVMNGEDMKRVEALFQDIPKRNIKKNVFIYYVMVYGYAKFKEYLPMMSLLKECMRFRYFFNRTNWMDLMNMLLREQEQANLIVLICQETSNHGYELPVNVQDKIKSVFNSWGYTDKVNVIKDLFSSSSSVSTTVSLESTQPIALESTQSAPQSTTIIENDIEKETKTTLQSQDKK